MRMREIVFLLGFGVALYFASLIWVGKQNCTPVAPTAQTPCPPSPAAAQLDPIMTLSEDGEFYLDKRLRIRAVIVDGVVVWRRL